MTKKRYLRVLALAAILSIAAAACGGGTEEEPSTNTPSAPTDLKGGT